MRGFFFLAFLGIITLNSQSQELATQAVELFIGTSNVNPTSKNIIIYMQAHSAVWNGNRVSPTEEIQFSITESFNFLEYAVQGEQFHNQNESFWNGFSVCCSQNGGVAIFGYGLYKITTNESDAYFYLDYRDHRYGNYENYPIHENVQEADIWLKYDDLTNTFWIKRDTHEPYASVNGTTQTIWELKQKGPAEVSLFPNYYDNSLTYFNENLYSNLIWNTFSNPQNISKYKVFRCVGDMNDNNFISIIENSNTSYSFTDNTVAPLHPDDENSFLIAKYYVQAYNLSGLSQCSNILTYAFLENWENSLILANDINHPKLVWHPNWLYGNTTTYKVFRSIKTSPFSLIANVNSTTFTYIDLDYITASGLQARYVVKAYTQDGSEISQTNIVTTSVASWKQSLDEVHSGNLSFSLFQNYPNPFNPITKINYSLLNASQVTLKVYDSFGREVTTLVNEIKPEGIYESEFDGGKLASGLYFYQLKTNNFVETKKMLLLK